MRHIEVTMRNGKVTGPLYVRLMDGTVEKGVSEFKGFRHLGEFEYALRHFLASGEVAPRFKRFNRFFKSDD